jgi:hypothetical protein
MDDQATFPGCPAYLDSDGAAWCGLPAEAEVCYVISSTDGSLDSAKITCPRGHHFNGLIDYLTVPEPAAVAAESASPLVPPMIRGRWPSLQRKHRPAREPDHGGTDD